MAVNLLESVRSYLQTDVVGQVSKLIDESEEATQRAFDKAFSVVQQRLIQKIDEPGGPGAILDLIGEVRSPDKAANETFVPVGGIQSELSKRLTDDGRAEPVVDMGQHVAQDLFGDHLDTVAGNVATDGSIKTGSALLVLGLSALLLLEVIGRQLAHDASGLTGLKDLLHTQPGQ